MGHIWCLQEIMLIFEWLPRSFDDFYFISYDRLNAKYILWNLMYTDHHTLNYQNYLLSVEGILNWPCFLIKKLICPLLNGEVSRNVNLRRGFTTKIIVYIWRKEFFFFFLKLGMLFGFKWQTHFSSTTSLDSFRGQFGFRIFYKPYKNYRLTGHVLLWQW